MKRFTILLFVFAFNFINAQEAKRPLRPSDVYRLQSIGDPQISTDGKWIAYVLSSVDTSKDKRTTDLWMVNWDGSETVQLTSSQSNESVPRWSPDGKYLSFLSSRKEQDEKVEEGSQLWLMDRRGGEAKRLSSVKGEIEEYCWSPDGNKILLTIKDKDLSDTAKSKVRAPFVIDRYHFKQDYLGYLDKRTTHLYLLDVSSKKLDTLTKGNFDEHNAVWSPNAAEIAFVSNRTDDPDRNENSDIYLMELREGAEMKKLTTWTGSDGNPVWSPDGNWIAYLQSSSSENFTMYGQPILAIISKNGGKPVLLSEKIDRPVIDPHWSKDSKSIFALMEDDRKSEIISFNIPDGKFSMISGGEKDITHLQSGNGYEKWVAMVSDPQTPAELFALEKGKLRRLTHVQDSFLAPLKLASVSGFTSVSKDGTKVSGILYLPPNIGEQKKLPLILFIHGGPVGQDTYRFDLDRQMYASAGYAVAAVNYRGSNGRGLQYIRAIYGDWGNKEEQDIIGAADYLIKEGIADENRMGIAGWSYGGISTNYTIATDQRFKAAVSGAGSSLQLSMYGVDQYITQYENEIGSPWKNRDKWIQLSYPFFHADKIKTPTLFMASQNDFNVPVAGAEQMYQALRSLGIPTGLVIYPSQNHGLSIPSYIKDRFERHIQWFNKYLKKRDL
ncbi:MAG: S9 family peptidase [Flavisolibacter sp.]